jgi:hypothetical protein
MRTRCPSCGATSSLDVLVTHDDARAALLAVFALSGPLGVAVQRYLALHRPATRELTMARVATLTHELLPYIQAGSINRKGRDWAVTPDDWVQAIDQMRLARDAGKLSTPLNGHGYLLEVLAGLADKAERITELSVDASRRDRPSTSASPQGGAVANAIGSVLAALVIRPPAPVTAAGMSPLVRAMKANAKKPPTPQPTTEPTP